ncbi:MAG: SCO family protein [Sphingomonadaceae bacterium]|nr:SCO family protein [Sphingomonadaceae bacterium]
MNKFAPIALLLVAACGQARHETPPLAGARIGGPFALTDEDGRAVTDKSFAGKYRIVYFGYTNCPDVCPTDVAQLMRGYRAFAKADRARATRIVPLFVSVDPKRDTPALLRDFTAAFDPHLIGLTGSAQAIKQAADEYGVAYSVEQTPGASGYLVSHSRAAYLMDPDGKPLALLPQDGTVDAIAAELNKWVT